MLKRVLVGLLLLTATACGSSTAPAATQANIVVTPRVTPIVAERCNPLCFGQPFRVNVVFFLQETAGVAGDVTSARADFSGVGSVVFDASQLLLYTGTRHVVATGTWQFPVDFVYSTTSGKPDTTVTFSVAFTDANGHQISGISSVAVN